MPRRPWATRTPRLTPLLALYEKGHADGGFEGGVREALSAILASPYFLFQVEGATEAPGIHAHRLTDLELASRLSFFLWGSIPDEELLGLATTAPAPLNQDGCRDSGRQR